MSEDREATHRREACQLLGLSDGWRVLLGHIVERLTRHDRVVEDAATLEPLRQQGIGARKELKYLVDWVSKTGDMPNPFDVHRQALWSEVAPKFPEPQGEALEAGDDMGTAEKQRILAQMRAERQRGGGGIA